MNKLLLFIFTITLSVATFSQEYGQKDIASIVYMIGDAGDNNSTALQNFSLLKAKLEKENPKTTSIIFLGDNIYPHGLTKKKNASRQQDEDRLNAQLKVVRQFKGQVTFIPGNHDWEKGHENGYNNVRRQQKYIEKALDRKHVFLPENGCGDVAVKEVGDNVVTIFIDTQWWLHTYKKGRGEEDGCTVHSKEELLITFKELLKKYRRKNVIVAGHHPFYSNGLHGGKFPASDHLFPLQNAHPPKKVPFPIIGSIYPLYRSILGHRQDISHPEYTNLKKEITSAMNQFENVVYAAGHEHSLQYFNKNNNHYIVSGSGSKNTHVKKTKKTLFGSSTVGFNTVTYLKNGDAWLHFYDVVNKETPVFSKKLYTKQKESDLVTDVKTMADYPGVVKTSADSTFKAGTLKRLFFGRLNRDFWTAEVSAPVIDLNTKLGGLTPSKLGGGFTTNSLHLTDSLGNKYVLRSVKKSSRFLIDYKYRNTVAQDILYDGIGSSHPYSALLVPHFTKATGIYAATPELVYVPKTAALGEYIAFGDNLCLFEMKPDDDIQGDDSFGNSKDIASSAKVVEKRHQDADNLIDVPYVIKARILDMFLGDWDRHDDQWKWAAFKEGKKTVYRVIPRDRDQALFKIDGVFPWLTARKWLVRKLQNFDEEIRDIKGLNFNARYFDRDFLSEANREQWIEGASTMQKLLRDSLIESCYDNYPEELQGIRKAFVINTLKKRRDQLVETAKRHYKVLSKEVDVVGTLGKDYFKINRKETGEVLVQAFEKKDSKTPFYERTFTKETKEIRLYGLDGKDEYEISGNAKKSVLVRIVAGENDAKIVDDSRVSAFVKKTKVYLPTDKGEVVKGKETRVIRQQPEESFIYNRKDFKYDNLSPIPYFGFNQDDGLYLGGGFKYVKHGFKKSPYKYSHSLAANTAVNSEVQNIKYQNEYTGVIGKLNLGLDAEYNAPLVFQFNGLGNEPNKNQINTIRVRMQNFMFAPFLSKRSKNNTSVLTLSPFYQRVKFENELTFVNKAEFRSYDMAGAKLSFRYENVDFPVNPVRGIKFNASLGYTKSLDIDEIDFLTTTADVTFFLPLGFMPRRSTLGLKSGFGHNTGDFAFFQSNYLSGLTNFRGITRNRYAGRTGFFNTMELHSSFTQLKTYITPLDIGALTHVDLARVWLDGENSSLWHVSVGGGLYVVVSDVVSIVSVYSVSDEDRTFTIGTKFIL
ncbi:MAG: metallophosphoesterase [Cyclobacteriaceae bacterium]